MEPIRNHHYAVTESHEPGSTFKLVDLMAILEDKVADKYRL
jgi:cell division protein FtsI (penicillin-binding protein 3)